MDSVDTAPGSRSRLLFVTASPRGHDSESISLAEAFLDHYRRRRPAVEIDRLDTFIDLPPFAARHAHAKMAVITNQPVPETAASDWAQGDCCVEGRRRSACSSACAAAAAFVRSSRRDRRSLASGSRGR